MDEAFPEANTFQYRHRLAKLTLPDADDKHVLAAAIEADAACIVTFNLKDFPHAILMEYGIKAVHSDDFIDALIQRNAEIAFDAFEQLLARLRNPPLSREYVLDKFHRCGLPKTAASLR